MSDREQRGSEPPESIKTKCLVLILGGLGSLFAVVNPAFAQNWTSTSRAQRFLDRRCFVSGCPGIGCDRLKWLKR
jgi:hypothetical protein